MGLLDRILGGLPENSLLRAQKAELEDKNAALETEIAILKDEKRDTAAQIKKLEKRIEELTHVELDETKIDILRNLPHLDYPYASVLATLMGTNETRIEYHLNQLEDADYVIHYQSTVGLPDSYHLRPKGKAYLVENNLDFKIRE